MRKIVKSKQFKEVAKSLSQSQSYDKLSESNKIKYIQLLLKLKYKDVKLLDNVCKDVEQGKISNIKSITNLLYTLAKFKYQPTKNEEG